MEVISNHENWHLQFLAFQTQARGCRLQLHPPNCHHVGSPPKTLAELYAWAERAVFWENEFSPSLDVVLLHHSSP